jgi:hypothetical protein
MTMLEYTKVILEKVSFDPRIFKKELKKAVNYVTKEEYGHLKVWVKQKFGKRVKAKSSFTEFNLG